MLLLTFANSLDPDQALRYVTSVPDCFDVLIIFLKELFEKEDLKKNQQTSKSMKNYPARKELNGHKLKGKPRIICGRLNTCGFVCGTISGAKSPLHWSVKHGVYRDLHCKMDYWKF